MGQPGPGLAGRGAPGLLTSGCDVCTVSAIRVVSGFLGAVSVFSSVVTGWLGHSAYGPNVPSHR